MVNDLGVNPEEWFSQSRSDDITDDYAPCDVEYDLENPDESDEIEAGKEPENIHELMYQLATKNGSTLFPGGSEEIQ